MKLRTEIELPVSKVKIDPGKPAVLLGSCFSDNIGRRMRRCRWDALVNPGGVLFNPSSIAAHLELALIAMEMPDLLPELIANSIFESDGVYHSWLFDSTMSALSAQDCVDKCRGAIVNLYKVMRKADLLVLTFGSSFVYHLAGNESLIVANCHKQPASLFGRRMLDFDEVVNKYAQLINRLGQINPHMEIVLTVSPVRHIKDGLHANTMSKGMLLSVADCLCSNFDQCSYFAAYEIMLDDLRDYRFYASDLVHPSEIAVDYIWRRFCEVYLDEKSRKLLEVGERLTLRQEHRSVIADAPSSIRFANETGEMLKKWHETYPEML